LAATVLAHSTFLGSGSDLKVFYSKLLDVEDRLLSFLLPVRVLFLESFNPPGAQVVILHRNLMREDEHVLFNNTKIVLPSQTVSKYSFCEK